MSEKERGPKFVRSAIEISLIFICQILADTPIVPEENQPNSEELNDSILESSDFT